MTHGQLNPIVGASPNFSGNSGTIPLNYLLNQFSNRNNPQYNQFANQQNTYDILSKLLNPNTNNNEPQMTAAFSKPCPNQNVVNNIVSKLLNTNSAAEPKQPNPQVVNNYIIVPTDFLNNNSTAENIQIEQFKATELQTKTNQGDKSERNRRNRRRKSQKDSMTQNKNSDSKRKRNRHQNVNKGNQSVKVSKNGQFIQQQSHSDNSFMTNNMKVNDQPSTNSNNKNNNYLQNGQIINTPYNAPYSQSKMTNAFMGYVPREYYPTLPQNNVNPNCLCNSFRPDYNNMLAKSHPQNYVDLEKSDRSFDAVNNDAKRNIVSQVSQNSIQVDTLMNGKEENSPSNNDENLKDKSSTIDDNLKLKFNRQEAVIKRFQHMFPGIPETVIRNLMAHLKRQLENGNLIKNNIDVQKSNESVHRSEEYNMQRPYESTYGMSYPMYYFNNNNRRCRPQPQYLQPSYRVMTQRCPNRNNPVRKAKSSKPNKTHKDMPKALNKEDKENSTTSELNDQTTVPLNPVVPNFEIENKEESQNNSSTETDQDSNKPIIEKEIITFRVPPTLESPNFLTRKVDVPFENKYTAYNNHPIYNTNYEEPYTKDAESDISQADNKHTTNEQGNKEPPKLETTYAHSKVAKYSPSTSTNNDESSDESNDSNGSHNLTSDNATIVIAESMPYNENDAS